MAELIDENNFTVSVNDKEYHVTVSYESVYLSHFKIASNGEYLFTISMDEEGGWHAEDNALDENLIEQIGRAIEQYDMA